MKYLFTVLAWAVPAAGLFIACTRKPAPAPVPPDVVRAAPAAEVRENFGIPAADIDLPQDMAFHFALGSDRLEETQKADALAAQLTQGDLMATLTGHACPLGPEAYNEALSLHRAMALAIHLERAGVPAWRLKVEALGESRPVAREPREYWKNRRVNVAFSIGVR